MPKLLNQTLTIGRRFIPWQDLYSDELYAHSGFEAIMNSTFETKLFFFSIAKNNISIDKCTRVWATYDRR